MRVVDANVLLYAVNADARHHDRALEWLDRALAGEDTVGFSWIALIAFARLSTRAEIFTAPLSPAEAMNQIDEWISAPGGRVLHPGERHLGILTGLLEDLGTAGNLVNDAHLAALAIEHRATVVSYDNDFSRFTRARWSTPDDLLK
ncbi:ribonuclease [Microbacterium sp. CH12i]|uniref:type II toxin-antitoxin system VapC family toxin n=1 Tax=Microbacterium sp. CH12i TaxID=1479651 RepID=UPI000460FBB0|nr:type II toxin-antitoxin system VapC family toxin [Microbacterium sp. CH12i]KDA05686.1 ribonuclease [Microbacterium sp. CH12i]